MSHLIAKTTAALLIAAAITAPAAGAQPIDPPRPPITTHVLDQASGSSSGSSTQAAPTSSDGFSWGDAAIGAAFALTLVTLGAGTVLVVRRGRERRPVTS
jgi:hypothetical protein